MKMRFIKLNLLLGDGNLLVSNSFHPLQAEINPSKSHPPQSPSADGGNLNLTSNYNFFSFTHNIIPSLSLIILKS